MSNTTSKCSKPYFGYDEMIKIWIERFMLSETTLDEEIEDTKGAISNERIWQKGADTEEQIQMHEKNISRLVEYLSWLEENAAS